MQFNVSHMDIHSKARCGELETAHGTIQTPVFMTVGTQGTVKGIHQYELKNIVNAPFCSEIHTIYIYAPEPLC